MYVPGVNDLEEGLVLERQDESTFESPRHSGYQSIGQGSPHFVCMYAYMYVCTMMLLVEETSNSIMMTPAKRSVQFSAEDSRPDLSSTQQRRLMQEMLDRLVGIQDCTACTYMYIGLCMSILLASMCTYVHVCMHAHVCNVCMYK